MITDYKFLELTGHELALINGAPKWRWMWTCFRDIRDWRKRRKLDKAILVLWKMNYEIADNMAHELKHLSDDLWHRALLRTHGYKFEE